MYPRTEFQHQMFKGDEKKKKEFIMYADVYSILPSSQFKVLKRDFFFKNK